MTLQDRNAGTDLTSFTWSGWEPRQRAVLCFIIRNERILLIEKKRGLGAGKVNGPGGKIDPGETPVEAAIRETEEEVGLRPQSPAVAGELFFQFADGLSIHCTVFRSSEATGQLIETEEARGFWCPVDQIPFEQMWSDDVYWFAPFLQGTYFKGYFTFDGDQMLSREVVTDPKVVANPR